MEGEVSRREGVGGGGLHEGGWRDLQEGVSSGGGLHEGWWRDLQNGVSSGGGLHEGV